MTKSILQEDETVCFLCGRNGSGDPLECLHIFGASNRKHSDKDGLFVFLCGNRCHRNGKLSAHQSAVTAELLKVEAQKAYEDRHTREAFVQRYGKNYL